MPPKRLSKKKREEEERKLEEARRQAQMQEEIQESGGESDEPQRDSDQESDRDPGEGTSSRSSSRETARDTGKRVDQASYSFPPDVEEKLVVFFSENRCFWDKSSDQFLNRDFKEKKTAEMAKVLNCDCKYKLSTN